LNLRNGFIRVQGRSFGVRGAVKEDKKKRKAFDTLWETRETLIKYLIEDVVEKGAILKGKENYEGALGFDFQEIDNKFMGRLASLNTFLHNLGPVSVGQARRPPTKNTVEVVFSSPEDLADEINKALKKHTNLKLVSTALQKVDDGLCAVLAFTSP
jgi:hypothetical protein